MNEAALLRGELRRLLRTRRVEVEPGGAGGEIAVVRVGAGALARLLAPEVRGAVLDRARVAGFRWAALDLSLEEAPRPAPGAAGSPA